MIPYIPVEKPLPPNVNVCKEQWNNDTQCLETVVDFTFRPYNRLCTLEKMRHEYMGHRFGEELICSGCNTDWNEHQLAGKKCPNPAERVRKEYVPRRAQTTSPNACSSPDSAIESD